MQKLMLFLTSLALTGAALAASPMPYDPDQDANAEVRHALTTAQTQHREVLLIFGANWCPDCRELDKAMHGSSARLIESRFVVVKVDVGNFDKNLDLSRHYGNPIEKGIPAAVVVAPDDRVLFSTKGGELSNARHMGEQGIYDYLSKALPANPS